MKNPAAPEKWKDIPGFDGRYQASTEGRIRRVWQKSGTFRMLKPYKKGSGKHSNAEALRVALIANDGRKVVRTVLKLVALTYYGVPDGMVPIHANGEKSDCAARNVLLVTNQESGKRFGADAGRRPVMKIDAAGEAVEFYRSAREAARHNYVSYQTVMDRCNGKVKKEFALDGYSYRWDD